MSGKDNDTVPGQYMRMEGHFHLKATFPDGSVEERSGKNLVTNSGEALAADRMDPGGADAAPNYIEFGSGTEAALKTDTQLQTPIAGTRTLKQSSSQVNNVVELVFQVTVGSTYTIREMGIFNAASAGKMVSRFLTQELSVVSGVVLDITWALTFSGVD